MNDVSHFRLMIFWMAVCLDFSLQMLMWSSSWQTLMVGALVPCEQKCLYQGLKAALVAFQVVDMFQAILTYSGPTRQR